MVLASYNTKQTSLQDEALLPHNDPSYRLQAIFQEMLM